MHTSVLKSLVVVVVIAAVLVPRSEAVLGDLLDSVVLKLLVQGRLSGFEFLAHECNLRTEFKQQGLQLYFEGEMACPEWTDIRGEAVVAIDVNVLPLAIKDFVSKVIAHGLCTEAEVEAWLQI